MNDVEFYEEMADIVNLYFEERRLIAEERRLPNTHALIQLFDLVLDYDFSPQLMFGSLWYMKHDLQQRINEYGETGVGFTIRPRFDLAFYVVDNLQYWDKPQA